ncbi:tRNA dimethylallyltransferase [Caminicella sporogenes DSM 14501]|uniref:tRNA dimethylallyltransferase n=1 Tax=Caminicella sporogenes DSM 14501 TaxID=1121266 RepID=A0A1M6L603_9FIRM|nr:tRNA (adenosine(37)-N6)-dimethylallyltransferase MiaA [Caminicella sporogenes]RKD27717.1 tRNA (adenosine(37)-N6)-dimethylallyltransferase MiaA [Caminicella sporogenes]SHJ66625.1 tRNA dimethylallyltransferase [Caminicella sporogenes DSM 14501]
MKKPLIIIVGPTAVGKTKISIEVAEKINGEIISADSMQIYKYLNIGSAKPSKEELSRVKHYLVDEIDPKTKFSVSEYKQMAQKYIDKILSKNKLPVVTGGTGLYVNSLIYDMDFSNTSANPKLRKELEELQKNYGKKYLHRKLEEVDSNAAKRIHPNNVKRVIRALEVFYTTGKNLKDFSRDLKKTNKYEYVLIGLNRDRKKLYERINKRVDIMFDMGLVDEVANLLSMGLTEDDISMKGIGYKEVIGYINGEYSLEVAKELVKRNTRRYAKRQLTWFRRYDDIKWYNIIEKSDENKLVSDIIDFVEGKIKFI